ncbi:outer membrane beta-barrel protein [Spirosoma endbachense]|uniref:Outer membrane beta-barrel protein n=1 Tax=Spirosoma endbachense TaxID=2666025 RepID=A0A6P1VQF5_9BACT|nr:outer membrane beta-barrel protein [Spirosoma endbachense]QHV95323.1 outer membrane beta-barrel protein [Spirosoma endbachense]
MKKITTPYLTALLVGSLLTTASMGQSRFSIAPTLSPSYQHLNWVAQVEHTNASKGTQTSSGISVGLTTAYAFTPKWSLSAAILYNYSSAKLRYDNFTSIATQARRYENWQVPLLLNYTSSARRVSPYFSAGLLANHNYRITNTDTGISSYHKIDEGTTNAFTLYGMVGMGVHYRVMPNLALVVQPTAAYRINTPSGDYPIAYTSWNDYLLGLQTQLKISF